MTPQAHDDGFHEIQLNGKQLVFLFMAATVASVVIFLCGVLVGRGVRIERAELAQAEEINLSPTADAPPASLVAAEPERTDVDAVEAPPPIVDDLTYGKRLEESNQSTDELKPAAPRPAIVSPALKATLVANAAPAEKASPVARAPVEKPPVAPAAEPQVPAPGSGYAVQVAALNARSEADVIAKRLTSKGYAAYVQAPAGTAPAVFRVRVGTFKTRREAETVAARIQKEEQITPWITR